MAIYQAQHEEGSLMRESMNILWLLVDFAYPQLHDVKYP